MISSIILDSRCILCNSNKLSNIINYICDDCLNSFNKNYSNICHVCGHPLSQNKCISCNDNKKIFFDSYDFIQYYTGFFKIVLNKLKLNEEYYILNLFFDLLKYKKIIKKNIPITTVPDSILKIIKKGRSSLSYLLRFFKKENYVVYKNIFKKKLNLSPQKLKNKMKREEEIKELFYLPEKNMKKFNGEIYLIDDIFTTGSTINYGAKLLKDAGFSKVFAITFFRAVLDEKLLK